MMHSDDDGLVLPPQIAPIQVVMIPIYKNEKERDAIVGQLATIRTKLIAQGIRVKLDDNDTRKPGWKFADYELKGIPIRMALGSRDIENNTIELARRDTKEKVTIVTDSIVDHTIKLLDQVQENMYQKALTYQKDNTTMVDTYTDFKVAVAKGGFVMAHWDGTTETEQKIQLETKATIRCIPLDSKEEIGECIYTGNPSTRRVVFAQAY